MNARNGRPSIYAVAVLFCAVLGLCIWGVHGAKVFIQEQIAATQPDSPQVAELLGGLNGSIEGTSSIPADIGCQSTAEAKAIAVPVIESTASQIEEFVERSRKLLEGNGSLTSKDRGMLGQKISLARTAAAGLRGVVKSLNSCSISGAGRV